MDFNHAFSAMLTGEKVRLPSWAGYWAWERNTIMMHCKNGEVIDIRYTCDPKFTFSNVASLDWEIVPAED